MSSIGSVEEKTSISGTEKIPLSGLPKSTISLNRVKQHSLGTNVYLAELNGISVDGKEIFDAAITSGSAVLSSSSGMFQSSDVNKPIVIDGAGSGGGTLRTTILSYQSTNQVTLSANAGATVSGKTAIWGTDNGSAIQALIDAIALTSQNSVIQFTPGICVINSPLQDTSRINAQVILPYLAVDQKQYTLTFRGEGRVTFAPSAYYYSPFPSCTRLVSFLSQPTGNFISGRGPIGGVYDETSFVVPCFENIVIQMMPKTQLTALNFSYYTNCLFRGGVSVVSNFSESALYSTQPTEATSYGVKFPSESKGIYHSVEGTLNIMGFYNGARIGELSNVNDIGIYSCVNGLVFDNVFHPSYIQRALIVWCNYGLKFNGAHRTTIQNLAIEHWGTVQTPNKWYFFVRDCEDPTNLGTGEVNYNTVTTGGNTLWYANGGLGLLIRKIGDFEIKKRPTTLIGSPKTYDSFSDANNVSLSSHLPDVGGSWTRFNGNGSNHVKIFNGVANSYFDNGTPFAYGYVQPATSADVTIRMVCEYGGPSSQHYNQIVFRYSDTTNYWYASCHGGGLMEIRKVVGGVDSVVASGNTSINPNVPVLFTVTLSGDSISFSHKNITVSATDTFNNTATQHGIQTYQSGIGQNRIHEFLIS